ncbi:hypothetical protein GCM10028796_19090 [Ramlibacter monticola]|uniref:Uncharacterized protein n=1 Tax=Ramlibacter monticola TaxID=1926872 RepID=A0A936YZ92_9BURK|nr:hypothetical protein [Ramlibacter monticola]MBL0392168.1 hypothetical protein [Ramlibacter monticola]
MKKTSLTRALFVAGVMAVAGGMAQADAIFYPDGTHVELGGSNLVLSSDDTMDTTVLGAGPAPRTTYTTVTTTTPVYVFPNINWDRATVLSSPHPMMSSVRSLEMDRTAAATFDVPSRAGEASTMTSGAPNLVTTNESVASLPPPVLIPETSVAIIPPAVVIPETTSLGAGPSFLSGNADAGTCGTSMPCTYLPD